MQATTANIFDNIRNFLINEVIYKFHGNKLMVEVLLLCGVAIMAVAGYYLTKLLLHLTDHIIKKTPTEWDNDLMNRRMMNALSQLTPAIIVNWLLPNVFTWMFNDIKWLSSLTAIYIVGAVVWIIWVFIANVREAFEKRDNMRIYASKGIFQMFKLLTLGIGIIIAVSIIIHKSPVVIFTALGASAAVLILIFQDTILGWVTSIQFMANNLLHHGDWIEDKVHDINGEVQEITLSAVKVRNWDNSQSVIQPHLLLKSSFRNYQHVRLAGVRRVSRAIYIDMNSVGFCTPEQMERLHRKGLVTKADMNGQSINLTLLRRYLERYLRNNPDIDKDSLRMVRQLEPTNAGLPLELYFFLSTTSWPRYEELMCDIFDHVYAVVREFGIQIFQTPAGTDLARAATGKTA